MAQQPTFVADIILYIGTDFTQTYVLEDALSNSPLDLTGYSACSSMRRYPTSSVAGTFNILFTSDRTTGKISIEMLKANTANLKAGKYFYDIVLQNPSGEKTRPIEGTITVRKPITR